ncbi:hypothetical protein BSZ19_02670 [Bradyrhizobium japonicum]|uniref:Uncharacterized protein n=2 Tax=Bradyrhizobium japonicum TaxID=375 RepID=A0A1Y2JX94_BRAJP|nr:hypothetical protein BSZ19_02670 [Bradyrhizobium japonicum]
MTMGAVQFYAQAMRDAGLLTKGGRGLAAAHLTVADVSNWLLALCVSETAAAAPEEVNLTREAAFDPATSTVLKDVSRGLNVTSAKTAGEAIELLMRDMIDGRFRDWQGQKPVAVPTESESWHLGILIPTAVVEFVVSGQSVSLHLSKPTEAGRVRTTSMRFVRVDPMFKMRMKTVTDWNSRSSLSSLTRINRVGPRVFERLADALRSSDDGASHASR